MTVVRDERYSVGLTGYIAVKELFQCILDHYHQIYFLAKKHQYIQSKNIAHISLE